jgi:DNA-binding IclR family transcriptional regulator
LADSSLLRFCGRCLRKQSAKISRLLKRLYVYGLIAKIPRSRRWRLTKKGWALLSAAVTVKEHVFPALYEQAKA